MCSHIYTYYGTCVVVRVRDSLWELVLTLYHVDPRSQACDKNHHILSYFTAHASKRFSKMSTEILSRFKRDFDTICNIFISIMTIIYLWKEVNHNCFTSNCLKTYKWQRDIHIILWSEYFLEQCAKYNFNGTENLLPRCMLYLNKSYRKMEGSLPSSC